MGSAQMPRQSKDARLSDLHALALTPELLRTLLRYDPDTGKLFWLPRDAAMFDGTGYMGASRACAVWNGKYAGKEAFTSRNKGHCTGGVFRVNLQAHRVAWALMTGEWPPKCIDHINHDRADNRWCNLRAVTRAENSRNMALTSRNPTGAMGVRRVSGSRPWQAAIAKKHIGSFRCFTAAMIARRLAERKLGFAPEHGTP